MAEITRSIAVDAPIGEADQDGTESVFGTLVGHGRPRCGVVVRTPAADAEHEDIALLEEIPDTRSRVRVTVRREGDESAAACLDRDARLLETLAKTRS